MSHEQIQSIVKEKAPRLKMEVTVVSDTEVSRDGVRRLTVQEKGKKPIRVELRAVQRFTPGTAIVCGWTGTKMEEGKVVYVSELVDTSAPQKVLEKYSGEERVLRDVVGPESFAPHLFQKFIEARRRYLLFTHMRATGEGMRQAGDEVKSETWRADTEVAKLRNEYIRTRNALLFSAKEASDPRAGRMDSATAEHYRTKLASVFLEDEQVRIDDDDIGFDATASLQSEPELYATFSAYMGKDEGEADDRIPEPATEPSQKTQTNTAPQPTGYFESLWGEPLPQEVTEDNPPSDVEKEVEDERTAEEEWFAEEQIVDFKYGRYVAYRDGEEVPIVNARQHYLLPGDVVTLIKSERGAEVVAVDYQGNSAVLGQVEEVTERGGASTKNTRKRYVFVVRAPGPYGVFEKYKFSIRGVAKSVKNLAHAVAQQTPIIFDRTTETVVEAKETARPLTPKERAELSTRIRLGIKEFDPNAENLRADVLAETNDLYRHYEIPASAKGEEISASAEAVLRREIDEEVAHGRVRDLRLDPRRAMFFIDPVEEPGKGDHDDVISVMPLTEDEAPAGSPETDGWYEFGIHIADPTRFVLPRGAIDYDARKKGTSVYFGTARSSPMLPRLIAEHLASLNEGHDRFAHSLVFKARLDEKKGLIIRDIYFGPTAVSVTEGIEYSRADRLLQGVEEARSKETAPALATAFSILTAFQKRTRKEKLDGSRIEPMEDSKDLVQTAMETYMRFSADMFTRYKRSPHTNLRKAQEMVLGIYRNTYPASPEVRQNLVAWFQEPWAEDTEIKTLLNGESFLTEADIAEDEKRRGGGNADSIERYNRLFKVAMKRIKKLKRPKKKEKVAVYNRLRSQLRTKLRAMKSVTEYSADARGNPEFDGKNITRATSPLRRYADLMAERALSFLHYLSTLDSGEDISEDELREAVFSYAHDVIGVAVPEDMRGAPVDTLIRTVRSLAQKEFRRTLPRLRLREVQQRAFETATRGVRTLDMIETALDVDGPITPSAGVSFFFKDRAHGLTVENGVRVVYGEVTITKHSDEKLKQFITEGDSVTVLGKFVLPEGMEYPPRGEALVDATLVEAEVDKGRLTLEVRGLKGADEVVTASV